MDVTLPVFSCLLDSVERESKADRRHLRDILDA